jgi:hypothetical protein
MVLGVKGFRFYSSVRLLNRCSKTVSNGTNVCLVNTPERKQTGSIGTQAVTQQEEAEAQTQPELLLLAEVREGACQTDTAQVCHSGSQTEQAPSRRDAATATDRVETSDATQQVIMINMLMPAPVIVLHI